MASIVGDRGRAAIGVSLLLLLISVRALPALAQDDENTAVRAARSAVLEWPILPGGERASMRVAIPADELRDVPLKGSLSFDGAQKPAPVLSLAPYEPTDAGDVIDPATTSTLTIAVPPPPGWWLWQQARLVVENEAGEPFVRQQVRVSTSWLPIVLTLLIVGLIYPGIAAISWGLQRRRLRTLANAGAEEGPSFLEALDPVQLTAGRFGRASLSKLQIFGFSLIVFGLLLYFQFRYGVLLGLSSDVLYLLGISAAGAAGSKFTAIQKRRLSLANWARLVRAGWLGQQPPFDRRAYWRDLFTDGKELNIYSFQMGIFSLIVAIALIAAGISGFQSFAIPEELLALLGISQGVYVGGKAIEPGAINELDRQLDKVRTLEGRFVERAREAWREKDDLARPAKLDRRWAQDAVPEDFSLLQTAARDAETMFESIYGPPKSRGPLVDPTF